ncbi:MAG TPA: MBL fold metallo-hydrolase [Xanthomonadaceae bacterium]|nr:MBL fold metallo-hydrolase [Xanthomonadaceae bacterium]
MNPEVLPFFDEATATWTYLVVDPRSQCAAVIDPVLDFDPKSGRTGTASAQRIADVAGQRGLVVEWILETHAHADHLTAARWLRDQVGGRIAIGRGIGAVISAFGPVFNFGDEVPRDGSQFDHLYADGERFLIGGLQVQVVATPGHTPDSVSYLVGDALFVGDTLFMPDVGTARCDFPGGDAATLYRSVRRLLELPGDTRMFVCHDYPPQDRARRCQTSVAEQRSDNIHVRDGVGEDEYVALRTARDATLPMPTLMLPSLQVNLRAGALPPPEDNGVRYLKLPLDRL